MAEQKPIYIDPFGRIAETRTEVKAAEYNSESMLMMLFELEREFYYTHEQNEHVSLSEKCICDLRSSLYRHNYIDPSVKAFDLGVLLALPDPAYEWTFTKSGSISAASWQQLHDYIEEAIDEEDRVLSESLLFAIRRYSRAIGHQRANCGNKEMIMRCMCHGFYIGSCYEKKDKSESGEVAL